MYLSCVYWLVFLCGHVPFFLRSRTSVCSSIQSICVSSGSGSAHQLGGVQRQEPVLPDGDGDGGGSGSLRLHRAARPTAPAHRQPRPSERHRCSGAGKSRRGRGDSQAELQLSQPLLTMTKTPSSSSSSESRRPFWRRRRPTTSSKRLQSPPWTRVASGRRRAGRSSGSPTIQTPTDRRTVLKRRRTRTSHWT